MIRKKKYFNLIDEINRIEKEAKCTIQHCIVVSQRSTGKTYSFLEEALKEYFNTGEVKQAAYIRRWDSDFEGSNGARAIYNSLLCNGNGENVVKKLSKGKYDSVQFWAGNYILGKTNEETGKTDYFRNKVVCYGFSLNLSERYKGGSFPNITSILFDEFLTTGMYLKNEFGYMQSILSTIIRDRTDVRVFYAANNVSFMGYPCWDDWGFADDVKKIKKGETKIYDYEIPDPNFPDDKSKIKHMKVSFTWLDFNIKQDVQSASSIYFGFHSSSSKMITQGDWELPSYPHLPPEIEVKPKDILFEFFVRFHDETLHCECCDIDGFRFTAIHKKTTPIKDVTQDIVFTDNLNEAYRPNFSFGFKQKKDKIHSKIRDWISENPIYFGSNLVGYFFYQYVDQTKDITGAKS